MPAPTPFAARRNMAGCKSTSESKVLPCLQLRVHVYCNVNFRIRNLGGLLVTIEQVTVIPLLTFVCGVTGEIKLYPRDPTAACDFAGCCCKPGAETGRRLGGWQNGSCKGASPDGGAPSAVPASQKRHRGHSLHVLARVRPERHRPSRWIH